MSKWKYTHPEGVHRGMNYTDWHRWTLDLYSKCVQDPAFLEQCLNEARVAVGRYGSDSLLAEKWQLRYHGLEMLRESPKGCPDG
jgi:hypothetical protein